MKRLRMHSFAATAAFLLLSVVATAHAQSMKIPKPSDGLMPNPGRGKGLFTTHCASCHGADLKGTDKGPPMLHKVYEPSHHSDVAFQLAAARGVRAHHWQFGDMAPVPAVTPDDVAHITAFIRAEQRKVGIQ
jgi:mono/diheme cytochrome c family protein